MARNKELLLFRVLPVRNMGSCQAWYHRHVYPLSTPMLHPATPWDLGKTHQPRNRMHTPQNLKEELFCTHTGCIRGCSAILPSVELAHLTERIPPGLAALLNLAE